MPKGYASPAFLLTPEVIAKWSEQGKIRPENRTRDVATILHTNQLSEVINIAQCSQLSRRQCSFKKEEKE